ncbi:hypothetical protein PMN64_27030 [Bradyrhizobium sp. UFLA01-814]|uniref:hypothetical protein n=1 Tax=Bradyrhizobium sp. UFLA01-814 TaxID=3023480 RepID=UPI00398A8C60
MRTFLEHDLRSVLFIFAIIVAIYNFPGARFRYSRKEINQYVSIHLSIRWKQRPAPVTADTITFKLIGAKGHVFWSDRTNLTGVSTGFHSMG